jgi:hypothetical protein
LLRKANAADGDPLAAFEMMAASAASRAPASLRGCPSIYRITLSLEEAEALNEHVQNTS